MQVVPLASVPNQSFTVTLDGVRWTLAFKDLGGGITGADVSRDGVVLLSATRVLSGEALIPYRYLQTGNFLVLTIGDDLPNWGSFGASQALVYLSAAEIASMPRVTVGEILAAQFRVEYLFTDEGFYITSEDGGLIQDA